MTYAVPVKYMVVEDEVVGYEVLDTSYEGQGQSICHTVKLKIAHKIARALNRAEGYEYPDPE